MSNPCMWTRKTLEAYTRNILKDRKLILVSNREPYTHMHQNGRVVCIQPAGGLTAALKPIVSAVGGTWVAQASGTADRETASREGKIAVPPGRPRFHLRRLWLPAKMGSEYYEGLANRALWPLCHNVYQRPVYKESNWAAYRQANEVFARAVVEEANGAPAVVFIQDYHLALLPHILKRLAPDVTVAQFWHIPWPSYEVMRTFPWIEELVEGLLGNDVLGFHSKEHCESFVAAADRVKRSVTTGSKTIVREAGISIDFEGHCKKAQAQGVEELMESWKRQIGPAQSVGIGIDRLDYTKGIPERIRAIDVLLTRHPEKRGQFVYVQVAVPSRSGIEEYQAMESCLDAEVASVNEKWGTPTWKPVFLEKRNLPDHEMMALHRLADFCLVTPLHDGMNLVAKEFVASRQDCGGVLILSKFAGAAEELKTALQVNPFSEEHIAEAILEAMHMAANEKRQRMAAMREQVESNNIYRWAAKMIGTIASVRRSVAHAEQVA